ncbi:minor capsid protein [Halalkalibacter sp. APA_J-10(15)]|uniref:minor capsid protein n=1 Tax=Halalkalibacter sp. APA_J-10(15) TaxID=2933805 RepID=UPI001FF32787|nr:minor capsid protein [Halalkalibacter sp. APA_J-10(15)]MCK0470884.1 phage head morphogenesis protein [Halalkalibacter sp. APA_J-10(15)]
MDKLNNELLNLLEDLLEQSDDSFEEVLIEYQNSRDKLKQMIAQIYMQYGIDGELDFNQLQRTGVLKQFNEQVEEELVKIGTLEVFTITAILGAAFTQSYYRSAFTLEQNLNVGINFNRVNQSILDEFINQNWSKKHFSDRIWANQNALRKALSTNLEKGIRNGDKLDKVAKIFDAQFKSRSSESMRLVRTETAKIIEESREKIYAENGIGKIQWLSTLDSVTSEGCIELDGQIFDIDDHNKPDCPRHPNCRSTYVPYLEIGTNIRKDNKTKEYIPYQNYNEWAEANDIA